MARISKQDAAFLERFHNGTEPRAHTYFGAHLTRKRTGEEGVTFRVWAPNATGVSVVGDFNGWDPKAARMLPGGRSGCLGVLYFRSAGRHGL